MTQERRNDPAGLSTQPSHRATVLTQKQKLIGSLLLLLCLFSAGELIGWPGEPPFSLAWRRQVTADLPDLTVVSITSAQTLNGCPTSPAGLVIRIRNEGTAAAHNFTTTLTGGFTSCGPWFLASLYPGTEQIFFCPAGMPGASVYTATVDSEQVVSESNEENNSLTTTVWVITLPTCTPSATPTRTPTLAPTGWLGPLTVSGHVREQTSNDPIPGAAVGGYVLSMRGGGGALPVATTQPDGSYQLNTGFGIYDTDTFHVSGSAPSHEDASVNRSALSIYAGQPVDLLLRCIVPTPTPTPTSATFLHITVSLQGRPAAPHPAWQTPLRIKLYMDNTPALSMTRTCDSLGALLLEDLMPGVYSLQVKGAHTLSNRRGTLLLAPGPNLTHMGLLREGDCNDDDLVDILDFSLFRILFGSSDSRADLNNDGLVDILDFSLLRLNFGRQGPIEVSG